MSTQIKDESLLRSVGQKLKELRISGGKTHNDVYLDTNIWQARLESGQRNCTLSTLSELCEYYGLTLGQFFTEIQNGNR